MGLYFNFSKSQKENELKIQNLLRMVFQFSPSQTSSTSHFSPINWGKQRRDTTVEPTGTGVVLLNQRVSTGRDLFRKRKVKDR